MLHIMLGDNLQILSRQIINARNIEMNNGK